MSSAPRANNDYYWSTQSLLTGSLVSLANEPFSGKQPITSKSLWKQLLTQLSTVSVPISSFVVHPSSSWAPIETNTLVTSIDEVRYQHLISVFVEAHEPLINHGNFISVTMEAVG